MKSNLIYFHSLCEILRWKKKPTKFEAHLPTYTWFQRVFGLVKLPMRSMFLETISLEFLANWDWPCLNLLSIFAPRCLSRWWQKSCLLTIMSIGRKTTLSLTLWRIKGFTVPKIIPTPIRACLDGPGGSKISIYGFGWRQFATMYNITRHRKQNAKSKTWKFFTLFEFDPLMLRVVTFIIAMRSISAMHRLVDTSFCHPLMYEECIIWRFFTPIQCRTRHDNSNLALYATIIVDEYIQHRIYKYNSNIIKKWSKQQRDDNRL